MWNVFVTLPAVSAPHGAYAPLRGGCILTGHFPRNYFTRQALLLFSGRVPFFCHNSKQFQLLLCSLFSEFLCTQPETDRQGFVNPAHVVPVEGTHLFFQPSLVNGSDLLQQHHGIPG